MAGDPPPVAAPAPTRWNAAPPAALPPAPNTLPRVAPTEPVPAAPSRYVIFQKPADPPPAAKPIEAPLPTPIPQPPGPAVTPGQTSKDSIRILDDPTFLSRPPAALPREKVFQVFESDEQLRQRVTRELADEQYQRELRDYEMKKTDPTFKGMKPTMDAALARQKFPDTPPLAKPTDVYVTKAVRESYPPGRVAIEPNYVIHRRLGFEEQNAERFGWEAGIAQPLVSTLYFYKDVLLWPSKLASYPFERYDTSAGKCLPGSPLPYYLYPPEISLFGGSVGAATIVGAAFLFP